MKKILRTLRGSIRGDKTHKYDRSTWTQLESLIALYRVLDGKDTVPATRRWAMSPDILLHIARLVRDSAPQSIVECGCGSSTIVAAQMVRTNGTGHVYSLEHEKEIAAQVRQELKRRGLEAFATVIDAPLVPRVHAGAQYRWYTVSGLPASIDLLIVDGPPGATNPLARYPAGPELLRLLSPNGKVILDDAKRKDESALPDLWKREFPDLMWRTLHTEKGAIELWKA